MAPIDVAPDGPAHAARNAAGRAGNLASRGYTSNAEGGSGLCGAAREPLPAGGRASPGVQVELDVRAAARLGEQQQQQQQLR